MLLQMALFHSFYGWVIFHIMYIYHIFFICTFVHGHLRFFHILPILNSSTMNTGHPWMFSNYDFLWIYAQEWDSWIKWASLVAWTVKNPPAVEETWLWSLGQKGSLEKGWLPIPIFLPGEFQGQRSLISSSPWDHIDFDRTEWLTLSLLTFMVVLFLVFKKPSYCFL